MHDKNSGMMKLIGVYGLYHRQRRSAWPQQQPENHLQAVDAEGVDEQ
jgi:hypothetical protein